MRALVTIGIPVYRGALFLEETLHSIQRQTFKEFEAVISVDGPDPACEDIGRRFLGDSRFRLVVQPERLGWVGNLNWLMSQVTGDFWYFHQQDDLTAENYLEVLIDHARQNPGAALVYCDVVPFGRIDGRFEQPPSVLGSTAYIRQMTLLHQHYPAFAFRGLTRVEALAESRGIPTNDVELFGVDTTWLAGVARWGELHRVPLPLYRKRYHSDNTESKWWAWTKERRLEAWCCHSVDMLQQALHVDGTAQELRLLWLAAIERLESPRTAGHFLPVADLTRDERRRMFAAFFTRAQASKAHDIPVLLDATWDEIRSWSAGFYWIPIDAPLEIVDFGPNPITCGEPFNVQPDGGSAIWVRTSRRPAPGSRIQLGDTVLDTVLRGTLLTASVPPPVTSRAGPIRLVLVGPGGCHRSEPAMLQALEVATGSCSA